jgi:hypothetical protein
MHIFHYPLQDLLLYLPSPQTSPKRSWSKRDSPSAESEISPSRKECRTNDNLTTGSGDATTGGNMGCRTVNRVEALNSRAHHQSFQELDHEMAKG